MSCHPVHGFLQAEYNVSEDSRLETEFRLNVKGTTQFPGLFVGGTITAQVAGTASNNMCLNMECFDVDMFFKVASDFEQFLPIAVANNRADIQLFPADDKVALEYNDRVMLMFDPRNVALIPGLEDLGEYIRESAIVNIIDNDRKLPIPKCTRDHYFKYVHFVLVVSMSCMHVM